MITTRLRKADEVVMIRLLGLQQLGCGVGRSLVTLQWLLVGQEAGGSWRVLL